MTNRRIPMGIRRFSVDNATELAKRELWKGEAVAQGQGFVHTRPGSKVRSQPGVTRKVVASGEEYAGRPVYTIAGYSKDTYHGGYTATLSGRQLGGKIYTDFNKLPAKVQAYDDHAHVVKAVRATTVTWKDELSRRLLPTYPPLEISDLINNTGVGLSGAIPRFVEVDSTRGDLRYFTWGASYGYESIYTQTVPHVDWATIANEYPLYRFQEQTVSVFWSVGGALEVEVPVILSFYTGMTPVEAVTKITYEYVDGVFSVDTVEFTSPAGLVPVTGFWNDAVLISFDASGIQPVEDSDPPAFAGSLKLRYTMRRGLHDGFTQLNVAVTTSSTPAPTYSSYISYTDPITFTQFRVFDVASAPSHSFSTTSVYGMLPNAVNSYTPYLLAPAWQVKTRVKDFAGSGIYLMNNNGDAISEQIDFVESAESNIVFDLDGAPRVLTPYIGPLGSGEARTQVINVSTGAEQSYSYLTSGVDYRSVLTQPLTTRLGTVLESENYYTATSTPFTGFFDEYFVAKAGATVVGIAGAVTDVAKTAGEYGISVNRVSSSAVSVYYESVGTTASAYSTGSSFVPPTWGGQPAYGGYTSTPSVTVTWQGTYALTWFETKLTLPITGDMIVVYQVGKEEPLIASVRQALTWQDVRDYRDEATSAPSFSALATDTDVKGQLKSSGDLWKGLADASHPQNWPATEIADPFRTYVTNAKSHFSASSSAALALSSKAQAVTEEEYDKVYADAAANSELIAPYVVSNPSELPTTYLWTLAPGMYIIV